MKFKFNSKILVIIFEEQLKTYICENGRPYKIKSKNHQILIELLSILNISINIINPDKRKKNLKLREIILKSLIFYKKEKLKRKKNKTQQSSSKNKLHLFKKILITPLLFILIILTIFMLDISSIQAKINSENLIIINSLKTDYEINKCEKYGNLSSLNSYCNNLNNQIIILQKKTPTLLSTFFIWILDILNSAYTAIGIKKILITILFLLIIKKIYLF